MSGIGRLYRNRRFAAWKTTIKFSGRKKFLRRQNFIHFRQRQKEIFWASFAIILFMRTSARNVSVAADQSHFQTVQKKTISQKYGTLHRIRIQSGVVQSIAIADRQHAVSPRWRSVLFLFSYHFTVSTYLHVEGQFCFYFRITLL